MNLLGNLSPTPLNYQRRDEEKSDIEVEDRMSEDSKESSGL